MTPPESVERHGGGRLPSLGHCFVRRCWRRQPSSAAWNVVGPGCQWNLSSNMSGSLPSRSLACGVGSSEAARSPERHNATCLSLHGGQLCEGGASPGATPSTVSLELFASHLASRPSALGDLWPSPAAAWPCRTPPARDEHRGDHLVPAVLPRTPRTPRAARQCVHALPRPAPPPVGLRSLRPLGLQPGPRCACAAAVAAFQALRWSGVGSGARRAFVPACRCASRRAARGSRGIRPSWGT